MTFTLGRVVTGSCSSCGAELPDMTLEASDAQHFKKADGTYSYSGMCRECLHKAALNGGSIEPKWG